VADGDSRQYEGEIQKETETALVWDLPVRVFHWTLVVAIAAAYVTNKLGVAYFKYHVWCGYTVLVLIGFRIVWGFVGTRHARFFNFVRGPRAIWRYIRGRQKHWPGHNPLGAMMVLVLLVGFFIQAATGLFGNDEIFNVGPLYGYVSNELSLRLTSLHRQLFYWLAGAIGLHIAAVIGYRVLKKEKLIEAMFTGRKALVSPDEAIHTSRTYLAIAIGIAISALLIWLIMTAPVAVGDISY
jgi:cytochrome b